MQGLSEGSIGSFLIKSRAAPDLLRLWNFSVNGFHQELSIEIFLDDADDDISAMSAQC